MSKRASQPCGHCGGVISAPKVKGRKVTLEQAVEHHQASCPGLLRSTQTRKGTNP